MFSVRANDDSAPAGVLFIYHLLSFEQTACFCKIRSCFVIQIMIIVILTRISYYFISSALDAPVTTDDDLMMVPGSENGYVEEASEYRFFLYRHWSLYDAMFHSPYVAAKLNVWNQQGTAKLQVRLRGYLISFFVLLCSFKK